MPEDKGLIKLYKLNDLVNLRLTKPREDILHLLNEKKMQGLDISEYLASVIRRAEGLEEINRPAPSSEKPPGAAPSIRSVLDESQMDVLVSMVVQEMMSRGLAIAGGSKRQEEREEIDGADAAAAEEERRKEELKKATKDMLEW